MPWKSPQLEKLTFVRHHFGDIDHPSASSEPLQSLWQDKAPHWKQVHGDQLLELKQAKQSLGNCDAIWTQENALPVAVVTADCVPVLLAHSGGRAVAAIHAGWRGTFARIVEKSFATLLKETKTQSAEWRAAIGPSIGICCYEVSQEMIDDFQREFPQVDPSAYQGRHIDLKKINRQQLKSMGLDSVDVCLDCTFCSKKEGQPLFHSFRREKKSWRQWSMISLFHS